MTKFIEKILVCLFMALWAPALSAQTHFTFDYRQYQYDMTVYFVLKNNNQLVESPADKYEVGAIVNDECRGVGEFVDTQDASGQPLKYGYLRVYSNVKEGEFVIFKLYDKATGKVAEVTDESFAFTPDAVIGMPSTPRVFNVDKAVIYCTVEVNSANPEMGTVKGGGVCVEGVPVTLTAKPVEGHVFVKWSDGSTDNPYVYVPTGNAELTATFAIGKYTMTFVKDNGQENEVLADLEYNTPLAAPANFRKKGFTFLGWEPEVPETVPGQDMTFTAQWERNHYKVTWVIEGESTEVDYAYEDVLNIPAVPAKTGYSFAGWSPEVPETMPAQDATYTAQYAINQYTMTFVLDNGEENLVIKQDYNSVLTAPADPEKEGFTFAGWDMEIPENIPATNMTFTAQWERNSYTVTWVVDGQSKSSTLLYDTPIVQPADPEKEGYTFKGWTPVVPERMPAEDVTYTAMFGVNTYAIVYVINGEEVHRDSLNYGQLISLWNYVPQNDDIFNGWKCDQAELYTTVPAHDVYFWDELTPVYTITVSSADEEKGTVIGGGKYAKGTFVTLTAKPNEGYQFVSWSNETAVNPYVFAPTQDSTLTATFAPKSYNMTFVLDNGSNDVVIPQLYNTALTEPDDVKKEGFTFKGWNPALPEKVPATDMTFTAIWERNNYKLTWVVDGVSTESTVAYDSYITLPEDPAKEGFTFTGWDPTVPEKMPAADQTFTAKWQRNTYKVTWIVDGEATVVEYDYEADINKPTDPEKEGFTFTGWSPEVPEKTPASDLTFTAQWQRNSYKLTWVVDTVSTESVVPFESFIIKPADPEKEGFTFTGWDPAVPEQMPASDQTFTAQWSRNHYKVTWIIEGVSTEVDYAYEDSIKKPADPVKVGYTFLGWSPEVAETMPAQDLRYTARFAINSYSMTFVLGNGEEDVVITQEYMTPLTAPEDPTKTGCTFLGWNPEVPDSIPASDMTFTAQWQPNTYKVTWIVEGQSTVKEVVYGTPIEKPTDPTKEGYTFTGWTPEVPDSMPANDMTFTAQFSINQYKMTFVFDNGEENIVKTQDYGTDLTAPADPTKTGFTFKGWDPAVPATVPASDMTFTAQWERNIYKVTWIVEGQSTVKDVAYGSPIEKPTDPTKEGYTFTGWTPEVPATMPANDLTFTAQFSINQYKMTFVLGNGQENVVKTLDYGTALTAPANPTRTGFTFKGWDPAVPATVPASDMTFTAQWDRNVYAVIYMVHGKEWQRDSLAYEAPIQLRTYSEDGWTFNGWVSDATYVTMPAHDVVYTADITSGIATILAGKSEVDVYTLQGRLVARRMPVAQIRKTLPRGVYIIEGTKVVIR